MKLENATYYELLTEINSRVSYSPNQKESDLANKIESIAQKRFLVFSAKELKRLVDDFMIETSSDKEELYKFKKWLYERINKANEEIEEIEDLL